MTDRTRAILQNLERVREDLLALSDDIWLSIDHNDNAALEEGVAFKRQYNERMAAFDRLAGELSAQIQGFTRITIEPAPSAGEPPTHEATKRIIRDLDQHEAHTLDESFTFKRPYGFRLGSQARSGIVTWRRLYEDVCCLLARQNPALFRELPGHPALTTNRGNTFFSTNPADLRQSMPLPEGIHAETNLSANHIRDVMRNLLRVFGHDPLELKIYFRQDRDAEE